MHRFFVQQISQKGQSQVLSARQAHQLTHVLRLKLGAQIALLDGNGNACIAKITEIEKNQVVVTCEESIKVAAENCDLSLFISLTQRDKFELILQKCTEIGVKRIIPFISSRSLVTTQQVDEKKLARWNQIIIETIEQSRGYYLTTISSPLKYEEAIHQIHQYHIPAFIAYEAALPSELLSNRLTHLTGTQTGIMIGPEGGFSDEEIRRAEDAGLVRVSLGSRILRMETAAIVASALVINHFNTRNHDCMLKSSH